MMVDYHIGYLFSYRCVLGFAAGDAWWCPFCRLKHAAGEAWWCPFCRLKH